jgi:hypothetical protein
MQLGSLLLQNQLGLGGLSGPSSSEINALQQALQVQQATFQQQLQSLLMHCGTSQNEASNTQAQLAAQIIMQNQVRII